MKTTPIQHCSTLVKQLTGGVLSQPKFKVLFKTAHAGMIFSGVSCKERQELDICEELTSTTGRRGRGLNRRPLSPRANTLPLSYPTAAVLF